jgi:glucose-1-phosphate cytidylyltransferase
LKALILAGGFGTRLAELTDEIPKPMVPIGNFPILIHIMSHFSSFGVKEFLILGGYKVEKLQEYFECQGKAVASRNNWIVNILDTGPATTTAGRLLKAQTSVGNDFLLTYGDGLADVDIKKLIQVHVSSKKTATVTAVRPPARFGTLEFHDGLVTSFSEKDPQKVGWINGGFFCLSTSIFQYLGDAHMSFESQPMDLLVKNRELGVLAHEGFWRPMDTLRDRRDLEEIWHSGKVPWSTEALR